jgi:hypothetical protein
MSTLKEETEDLIRLTLDVNGFRVIDEDIESSNGMAYTQWKKGKKQVKIYVEEM